MSQCSTKTHLGEEENPIEHSAVEFFDVPVHTSDPRSVNDSFLVEDSTSIDYDHCVVMTPTKQVEGKRKLVVFFHGAGEPVNQNSWIGLSKFMTQFFVACGYVVCASNGMPQAFAQKNNLSYERPVGNYMWIESACKMVEKVCREWNCDRNEIYVYGESQGGMGALNFIECGAIPVKSCVVDSPAISMLYSQLNIIKAHDNLNFFYGFNDAKSYTVEKVYGLDPFARNCTKIEDKADYAVIGGRYLSSSELDKCTSKRITRCPVKFFLGSEDTTTPAFASQLVYKQLKNAGQLTACDLYIGVGHCTDQNSKVIGTFSFRGNTYNITKPTIDMVLWWARFGGYDELPTITHVH